MRFPVAYQLYSARDIFEDDPIGFLKGLKESGYDGVELAGFYGKDAKYLRGVCDAIGLKIVSIHLSFWTLTENFDETVRFLKAYGCDYVAIPGAFGMYIGSERYASYIRDFSKLGRVLRDNGIQLLYHNHCFEFEKSSGELAFDVMYNAFDPELVKAELDCGFAMYCNVDPIRLIKKYRTRVPVLHLKDFRRNEGVEGDFSTFACPTGEGVLDLPGIFKAAEFSGVQWLVVEQDSQLWHGMDQAQSAERSINNLRKLMD
ncbi:MAG: TIM barrel protein [Clostridia bacterium]|nr:TIM barrel protein [Clostridia bacterium]